MSQSCEHVKRPGCRAAVSAWVVLLNAVLVPGQAMSGSAEGFPGKQWETAEDIESLGWSREKLDAAKAKALEAGSAAGMVVTGGKVIASWGDVSKLYRAHSVRKSFMSALYGIYVGEGKLDTSLTLGQLGITDKTPLTRQEQEATVLDLLKARSGVYIPAASEVKSMSDARPARGSHPPGTFWYYNNWDFNALGTIFRERTGADIYAAFKSRIADPIGMQDVDLGVKGYGYVYEASSMHPGYQFRSSARDLARFGLLYLRKGKWGSEQVIPAQWIAESTTSYSAAEAAITNSGYGYLWRIATRSERGIPAGAFTASGNGGQRMTVLPSLDTVVVNLMDTDLKGGPVLNSKGWDRLLETILQARTTLPN
jgi:CubicO group peptidase (beta-lactamase class C family)